MKTVWQVLFAVLVTGAVVLVYAPQAQQQLKQDAQKQAGAVTLDELYTVVTKDGKAYNDAKININHIGCFIISDKGYIYIPIENIKRITEVKYGSTDSTGIRGDVQRLPENR